MADLRLMAASGDAFTVISCHHEGKTEVLLGDPESLFSLSRAQLESEGYGARVVGPLPEPCPWVEACPSSFYLIRDDQGTGRWLESRSCVGPGGELLVNTRPIAFGAPELLRVARLGLAGGLLGPIAHELNNIVQGVSSAAYLFRDCLEQGDPIETEDLEQLSETATDLSALAAELQNFARQGIQPNEQIDLRVMLMRAVKLLTVAGRLKTVEFSQRVPEDLPVMYWCKSELELVLLALLSNAADAALERGTGAAVDLRVSVDGAYVLFELTDSGERVASLRNWGEPFRGNKAMHRHLGLGLPAVMQILGQRGGELDEFERDGRRGLRARLPIRA